MQFHKSKYIYKWNNIKPNESVISELYYIIVYSYIATSIPGGSDGKASACNEGDLGLIPGLGRSPGEGHDNPL